MKIFTASGRIQDFLEHESGAELVVAKESTHGVQAGGPGAASPLHHGRFPFLDGFEGFAFGFGQAFFKPRGFGGLERWWGWFRSDFWFRLR